MNIDKQALCIENAFDTQINCMNSLTMKLSVICSL